MIDFAKFKLENGLRVIVNEDNSTPMVALNILYDVGSRDEDPRTTGMAHILEHLMFSGTDNLPEFDKHLQLAGAENNAFTNNDITSYYITLPSDNIETGLCLESDRMNDIDLSQRNLDIQKSVVTEEFNQRYLNQPYGDVMLLLRPLAYKVHPYRWPAIGMDISHIRYAERSVVKDFYNSYYTPDNAILSLSGRISAGKAYKLANKWFSHIQKQKKYKRSLPAEPVQCEERKLVHRKDVPSDAMYKAWHIGSRISPDFYTLDLITDILSGGESGRLYTKLVKGKKLFSDLNAYITSDIDPGLLIFQGKLMKGVDFEDAEEALSRIIDDLKEKYVQAPEMEKVKNKFESSNIFSRTSILNKAHELAYFELLGIPEQINNEINLYRNITRNMIMESAQKYFHHGNCNTIYYKSTR